MRYPSFDRWALLSLAAAAGWGLQYAIIDKYLRGLKAVDWLALYFFGGALCCLISRFVGSHRMPDVSAVNWLPIALCIIVGVCAQAAIVSAIFSKNATQASLIENAVPLFAFLFGALLTGKVDLDLKTIIGGLLIFGGIAVVEL